MADTMTAPGHADVGELLDRLATIAPRVRAAAAGAERDRRLAPETVAAVRGTGAYAMARPRRYGGLEMDPVSTFRIVEELSRHDSAAGWNLNLSTAIDHLLAWLPDEGVAEVLARPDEILAGVFNPPGTAVAVEGGYRVSGRWRFVSGCQQAGWLMVLPAVSDPDATGRETAGPPPQIMAVLPTADTEIVDTWHTLGMRGTGSHDVVAEDVVVPARRTAPLAPRERPGSAYTGAAYRLTLWPAVGLLAAPALGIARAAIDDLVGLAASKTPSFTGTALRDRQVVQRQVAQAEAELAAGRALLHEAFRDAYGAALPGAATAPDRKQRLQLATSHATTCAARAVDLVHAAAGTAAMLETYRFPRHLRDVHTVSQHAFASAQRYESVGAPLLGAESDWGFFAF